jgi:hypothetical protein
VGRLRHATFGSVIAAVLAVACSKPPPAAGQVCKIEEEGRLVCTGASGALVCKGSRWVEQACRGRGGCAGTPASCDSTLARAGDACAGIADGMSPCSEDKKERLACRGGHFETDLHCRGPKGCDQTSCDRSRAAVGDECNGPSTPQDSNGVCDVTGKYALRCDHSGPGSFVMARGCGGPKGCQLGTAEYSADLSPVCDPGAPTEGGPCGLDDHPTCSADGSSLFQCDTLTHVWSKKDCQPKQRCADAECRAPGYKGPCNCAGDLACLMTCLAKH